jgi:hypothetical protein
LFHNEDENFIQPERINGEFKDTGCGIIPDKRGKTGCF